VADDRRRRFEQEALVHLTAVYNAALRLTRREDDARDLVQETLLRAYKAFDSYTLGTNARAWLLKILYREFVNRYHAARLGATVSIDDPEQRNLTPSTPPAAAALEPGLPDAWTDAVVFDAVTALPDIYRETVLLVDVEELSYEEAADVMGCAVGTVRSRLFRARRALAAALGDYARQQGLLPRRVEHR
jgi:RNA polymerase sigma-70 factor (ECF subfamily)